MGQQLTELVEIDVKTASDDVLLRGAEFILLAEADPNETSTPRAVVDSWRSMPDTLTQKAVHAQHDARIVGRAGLFWLDEEESRASADVGVRVLPDVRGRGIARMLLGAVVGLVPDAVDTVRTSASTEDGIAFARHFAFEPAHRTSTNRLVLDQVDRDVVDTWAQDIQGFSVIAIDGRVPDDLAPQFADLWNVMGDAPRGDHPPRARAMTVERIRSFEQQLTDCLVWHLIARDDVSGELAAFTTVIIDPQAPGTVFQQDTAVRPQFRGRGVAKLLKARMLQRILTECEDSRDVRTNNADANAAMVAINNRLGFEQYRAVTELQAPIAHVRAALERGDP